MRVIFYSLYGVFGLLGIYFVLGGLMGHYVVGPLSQGASKVLLVVGAVVGCVLLQRAYQAGEVAGRYGTGTALVVASVVAFQLIQVAGLVVCGIAKRFGRDSLC